jgi:hypothetical protein
MLGYIPGLLHAWYIIAKFPDASSNYHRVGDEEGQSGHIAYYYVDRRAPRQAGQPAQGTAAEARQQGYGTVPAPQPKPQSTPGAGPVVGDDAGEGGSNGAPPPTYADAVKADNKIQTQD